MLCALAMGSVLCAKRESGSASFDQKRAPQIVPSPLSKLVVGKIKEQPDINPKELAAYANTILAQEGFDYDFDLCEVVNKKYPRSMSGALSPKVYPVHMMKIDGGKVNFRISDERLEGMCSECFIRIPCLNVTRRDMLLVIKGHQYHLKRPKTFALDEMSLVDNTMKKVLRTWHVPYQGVPVGVSEDGTRLYLDLRLHVALETDFEQNKLNELVLEVSETGLRIAARDEVKSEQGELIEEHPVDPHNSYLSFERFRVGDQSYIIRYSGPCT